MNDTNNDTEIKLDEVEVIATGLVEVCRLLIAGGAKPEHVMDASLLLAVRVLREHLEPEQSAQAAKWLRDWAGKIERGEVDGRTFHA